MSDAAGNVSYESVEMFMQGHLKSVYPTKLVSDASLCVHHAQEHEN